MRELSPHLNTLFDCIPGMVYQCRSDWKHTLEYASKGCYALTGYPADHLIQNHLIAYGDLIYPDDREMVWINLQSAYLQKKPFELVYRIQTRTGEIKWVRDRGLHSAGTKHQLVEGFIADITDWKLAEEQIERQVDRFHALRAIDHAISDSTDLQYTLGILLDQIVSQLRVDAAAILLYRPGTQVLEYKAWRGFQSNSILHTRHFLDAGIAGRAAQACATVHIPELSAIQPHSWLQGSASEEGFRGYYGVPLVAKSQVIGVLEVYLRVETSIDPERLEFLDTLAGQAAIAVDNSSLFEKLKDSTTELSSIYDATLEGWAKALELRDRETTGHAHRVIETTLCIAHAMGISETELMHIRRGALLHDIGKMGIPDSILLKPGPLTPDEWEIMRKHPVHAYEMLKTIDYLGQALEIPYCHHERWDGNGYPRKLKAGEIPLSARIFAVVDVWDALTSDRPYRSAWSETQALEYIQLEAGRHFDPQVVRTFFTLKSPTNKIIKPQLSTA